MPVECIEISQQQVATILSYEESHFYDVKSIDIAPGKLTKVLSALANADGGEVYIGIDEDVVTKHKQWRGFNFMEDANSHLQVFEPLFPLGQYFTYTFLKSPTAIGYVLQVEIHKTPDIKRATDGTPYLRRGSQSLPVDTEEKLARLKLDKGITSFETETVGVEKETVVNSPILHSFLERVVPTAQPEPWLKKQRLIINDKPTVAGIVLYADEPQALLPKRCSIKIYRYQTSDAQGTRETMAQDPVTVEGDAYNQITNAVRITKKLVEGISKIGTQGPEKVEYPDETLHEIVTNAVLHRDYSIADDVHIRVFDNRIEVESPGRLPGHVTVANILDERFARNGNIVRLINKFPDPPNKDIGEGLNTAFNAMTSLRLKTPEIRQKANSVLVYIRHEPLASPLNLMIEYIEAHPDGKITSRLAREITHIQKEWTIRRLLVDLEKKGYMKRVAGTRTSNSAYMPVRKKS